MPRLEAIIKALVKEYGRQEPEKNDPLETLLLGILSQNTTDHNSSMAYESLIHQVRLKDILRVNTNKLAKIIHSGGLPLVKARRLKNAVKFWTENNLEKRIQKMTDDEIREILTRIDGVGPKTAEIVIMFGLGRQALPVDTHVWRVTRRLGLVPDKTSREKTAQLLRKIVPRRMWADYHMNIITHGRTVCKARNPDCRRCAILKHCVFGKRLMKKTL